MPGCIKVSGIQSFSAARTCLAVNVLSSRVPESTTAQSIAVALVKLISNTASPLHKSHCNWHGLSAAVWYVQTSALVCAEVQISVGSVHLTLQSGATESAFGSREPTASSGYTRDVGTCLTSTDPNQAVEGTCDSTEPVTQWYSRIINAGW